MRLHLLYYGRADLLVKTTDKETGANGVITASIDSEPGDLPIIVGFSSASETSDYIAVYAWRLSSRPCKFCGETITWNVSQKRFDNLNGSPHNCQAQTQGQLSSQTPPLPSKDYKFSPEQEGAIRRIVDERLEQQRRRIREALEKGVSLL